MYNNFAKKTIRIDRDAKMFHHYSISHRVLCNTLAQRIVLKKDGVVLITGVTGCLSGDTIVKISRAKNTTEWTLKHLYEKTHGLAPKVYSRNKFDTTIPLYIRSFNGKEIKLHKIKEVLYSGEKEVFELKLKNKHSIKATSNHKIMTMEGWKEMNELTSKDLIMCDTPNPQPSNRKRIKLRDIGLGVGNNHPYNTRPNRQIDVHRLIYEARMNNLDFLEYLDILLNEPEQCKVLSFVNPKEYVIHHKDGNHYNNSIENLEKLRASEHRLKHNNYSNFSQGVPKFSGVESVKFVGVEDTYDISCEEPYHNFVANHIVVHNSGKSTLTGKLCFNYFELMDNPLVPGEKMYTDDNFIINPEDYAIRMIKDKGSILWWDESRDGLSSKNWNKEINKTIVSRKNKNRKRGIISFVLLPHEGEVDKSFLKHVTMWIWIKERKVAQVFVAANPRMGGHGLSIPNIIDRQDKWLKENPTRRTVPPTIHPEYVGNIVFGTMTIKQEKRYDNLVDKHKASGKLDDDEQEGMNNTMDEKEIDNQIPLILDAVSNGEIKSKREMFEKAKEITGLGDKKLISCFNRHLGIRGLKKFNAFEV